MNKRSGRLSLKACDAQNLGHDGAHAVGISYPSKRGQGSLVGSLVTRDPAIAAYAIPIAARSHGRMPVLGREAAVQSTGHGSPLPQLKHGRPGRAGGGEELGGIRAVKLYLQRNATQRTALQGSPTMLAAVTGERKTDRNKRDDKGIGQGVVAWDVEVTNQEGELVASYDILTPAAKIIWRFQARSAMRLKD